MSRDKEEKSAPESLMEAWLKSATDFWGSMSKMWVDASKPSEKGDKGRVQESMESALKTWQTLSSLVHEPEMMDSLSRGIRSLPEVVMRMAQQTWDRYFLLQKQWLERAGKIGQKTEAYKFENIDEEAFRGWKEIYEEEFRKYFYVPQLGLTRFYQERIGRLTDKFNLFQAAMAEFMYLLYLPMEKSFKVMQEKLESSAKDGELPQNTQEYYGRWLRILEGHYMTLFKSPEYTQILSKTLDAMEDFTAARQEAIQDALQSIPVATNKDMDELYKELYQLKKRVKDLEKKQ